jgi:hypothetical protein
MEHAHPPELLTIERINMATQEAPSKYHTREYVGVSEENPSGYKYFWNSIHPDLEPTETFLVGYERFCIYCCNKPYSIQANLREGRRSGNFINSQPWEYEITGYTCICEGAEAEKEFLKKLEELRNEHLQQIEQLEDDYRIRLKENTDKRIQLEADYSRKTLNQLPSIIIKSREKL